MKKFPKRTLMKILIGTFSLILFLAVWWGLSEYINKDYLPGPVPVFKTFGTLITTNEKDYTGHYFSEHILASLERVFYGFLLALLVGLPIGLISGWLWYVESATFPIIELIRPIPPLAWIPFSIIVFAENPWFAPVFIVFLGAVFPIILNGMAGVKSVDPRIIDAGRTLGCSKFSLFRKVIIPASTPHIMTGIKVGLGVGWMCIVAAEFFGVSAGLGHYLDIMKDIGRFDYMFAGMVTIGIVGFLMIGGIAQIERRVSKWMGML